MNTEYFYYEDEGLLSEQVIDEVDELFEKAGESIEKVVEDREEDISVGEAVKNFVRNRLSESDRPVQDAVLWRLNIEANTEGVELQDMSAIAYSWQNKNSEDDIIPVDGISSIF